MAIQNQNYPNGLNPLNYMGVNAPTPAQQVIQSPNPPVPTNAQNFAVGTQWLVPQVGATPAQIWELVSLAGGVATWVQLYPAGGGGGGASEFPTDSGTANEIGGVLQIKGDGENISTGGSTNLVNVVLNDHITVQNVTVESMSEGVVVSDGSGNLSSIAGTAGQVLTSNGAGMVPTFKGEAAGGAVTALHADNGVNVTPSVGIITVAGGTGITTFGAGSTLTLNLTVPVAIANGGTNATTMANANGVLYYDGTRLVTTTVGTAGQVLTSRGAGMSPTFQPGGGGGGITQLTANTGGAATAASIKLQGNNVITTNVVSAAELDIALTPGTDGQVIIGNSIGAPAWASITAGTNITLTPGHNSLTIAASGTAPAAGCAFFYYQPTRASNVLGTQTFYGLGATVVMTSLYDNTVGAVTPGNGAGTPLQFTAPATGLYYLSATINTQTSTGSSVFPSAQIAITGNVATANTYFGYSTASATSGSSTVIPVTISGVFMMTMNDVAIFQVTRLSNLTLNASVNGSTTFAPYPGPSVNTWVLGYRVA